MPDSKGNETSGKEAPQNSFQVAPPSITMPKGGGAIRGMGEKFAANPVTGTGSMTVPIATSPGRSGFGPQLSLSYDSGASNGPFGFGWSLSMPSITRKMDKGLPRYFDAEESDVFILSGAEDLVPTLTRNPAGQWVPESVPDRTVDNETYKIRRYRPRIEGLFARIERWTNIQKSDDTFWRSISKDNITTWYGKTAESRIADPVNPSRIFSWLICQSYDDKGNVLVYGYKPEDSKKVDVTQAHERNRIDQFPSAQRYLKRIRYGSRKPYLPKLKENEPWPEPPGVTVEDGSEHWLFEVVFDYDEPHYQEQAADAQGRVLATASAKVPQNANWPVRNDPFSTYRAGFEVRTYRLCQRVLMFHHFPEEADVGKDYLVRSTDFTYSQEQDPKNVRNPIYSFLLSVTQSGYKRKNGSYLKRSLPPVEFEYTEPIVQDAVEQVDTESLENLPIGLDGTAYQWTDLHGEGIPGILTEQGGAWLYKRNLSPINVKPSNGISHTEAKFAPVEVVAVKPNLALAGGQAQFMDLAGDGQPDLVMLDGPTPGLYEHDEVEGWEPFRTFSARLNRDTRDPNLKFVDLNGDGHADVLITEDEALVWHESLAEEGFGPARRVVQSRDEEKGPRLVFADGTQSIYLADLSGDGLTDLVRIRNGEVCYWPNLGYGRFGAKVTMDQSPQFDHSDLFDHKRIRLADIDGSGTTDILYLHRDGVRLYFNQSGNSWSKPEPLNVFPRVDDLAAIVPTDLLGNGTACLVWSSPLPGDARRQMRYVDLMGSQKPHLLVKTINNLGAETRMQYAPSIKFYLQDKREGKPWITKLPFPVHVIERVETYDHISRNRFVTRYTYHHGYFDGEEREFRGFGRVDQTDTEEFAALTQTGNLPVGNNIDANSHVPPVLTKTWFHTGAYFNRQRLETFMASEYYQGDAQASLLADTILPNQVSADEEREACRSLKGAMLRQEVYANDAEPNASAAQVQRARTPYTVTEQNFTIRLVQPRGKNRHAVWFTHPREALSYHYERNPADPRAQHALTLEVDEFGNVLKSVAIGYGRRPGQSRLEGDDKQKQEQLLMTYTESDVTNPIVEAAFPDDYRTPLPSEVRTYEVTGIAPAQGALRFEFKGLAENNVQPLTGLPEIQYEDLTDHTIKQKRLIERVRTLYRKNNLSGLLPKDKLESMALPGESYKLALTPGLLDQVYVRDGQRLLPANPANVLAGGGADRGGYVDLDNNSHWWIPSGRMFNSPDSAHTAAQELDYARQHFFLPQRTRDPFHTNAVSTESVVTYDAYDLLMLDSRDPLGNRVTVGERLPNGNLDPTKPGNDYRVLQPKLAMDPNRNRVQVSFDALGMVAGTAIMGKPQPAPVEGDSLAGFLADLTQAQIDAFHDAADPHTVAPTLLQNSTTRIVYDLDRFRHTQLTNPNDPTQWQPACAATLARETHVSAPLPPQGLKIQLSFSYSDGFGREIQKKIQAEPGPLVEGGPVVNPRWVGSGWTVFNNKGKPVRQYEPFFTNRHQFEFDVKIGVSPVLFYDPVGRVVATLHPNHTWEKVLFDPWQQATYDVNDTILVADPKTDADVGNLFRRLPDGEYLPTWPAQRKDGQKGTEEQAAAKQTEVHAQTPTVAHADSLGRPFLTVAHNKFKYSNTDSAGPPVEEFHRTRVTLDIEGNQRAVRDAIQQAGHPLGRIVMRYAYDMLGNRIHQLSMEAGERWMLNDVAGKPLYAWDSRGFRRRMTYDALRRPLTLLVTENGGERVAEATEYGEGQGEATNHRGQVYRLKDGAGIVTNEAYDFKGNLRSSSRQLADVYKRALNWNTSESVGAPFETSTTYDALNRPVTMITPDRSIYRPTFNEANLLDKVEVNLRGPVDTTLFVKNIDYDAKGQRNMIEYGNGARTTYTYDPLTFRLTHLKTTRDSDNLTLQDLYYTYDPAGNITHIRDEAQQTIYFRNQVVEASAEYTYDAVYRLIEATGREHLGQTNGQPNLPTPPDWSNTFHVSKPHPQDGTAMGRYTERYRYDEVGNFLEMKHHVRDLQTPDWTRMYAYNEDSLFGDGKKSNRLSSSAVGKQGGRPVEETFGYDAHGNMLKMAHLTSMQWDFKDQLQQIELGGGGTAYYVYDASGQRIRKVWEKPQNLIEERIYLGGFEIFRRHAGAIGPNTASLIRETLHVIDDKQRIALIETRTRGNDPASEELIRYQLGNHLGSAILELDRQASIITYEEYFPYGSTSYQAVRSQTETAKRYRYTAKERDEESGLYYHGARYYALWLGRWVSCDPAGIGGSIQLYGYVLNNPVKLVDQDGRMPTPLNMAANKYGSWVFFVAGMINTAEKAIDPVVQEEKAFWKGQHANGTPLSIQELAAGSPSSKLIKGLAETVNPGAAIQNIVEALPGVFSRAGRNLGEGMAALVDGDLYAAGERLPYGIAEGVGLIAAGRGAAAASIEGKVVAGSTPAVTKAPRGVTKPLSNPSSPVPPQVAAALPQTAPIGPAASIHNPQKTPAFSERGVFGTTEGTSYLVRVGPAGSYGDFLFNSLTEAQSYASQLAKTGGAAIRDTSSLPRIWPGGAQGNPVNAVNVFAVPPKTPYIQGVVGPQFEGGAVYGAPKEYPGGGPQVVIDWNAKLNQVSSYPVSSKAP